jgi:hypothetical protein
LPSAVATTRRRIKENRELVLRVVRGVIETIHLFKTRPEIVIPLLERFMDFKDRRTAEAAHAFYVPLLPANPRPDLSSGMPALRKIFATRYEAAAKLEEIDIADASIICEVERSGFIERLYADASR